MTAVPRTYDPVHDIAEITEATQAFLATLRGLSDEELAGPSLLRGWSRSHVASHLARNADGNRNLLRWARTGIVTPMYPSRTARDADIEAGVGREGAALAADIEASHQRLVDEASAVPAAHWRTEVTANGVGFPAGEVLGRRLIELRIHHVDLAAAYSPAHWSAEFTAWLLDLVAAAFDARADTPPLRLLTDDSARELAIHQDPRATVVRGPEPALLAWLIGRANGDGLAVDPRGALPRLPDWL